jgi:hypothetical protein
MNITMNPTAYNITGSPQYMLSHVTGSYMTTIGLYDENDILMAIAKIS